MIDLGKPLGTHEGIVFYGDHEDDKIVYYLPDEIKFAPREDDKLDLHLTIFKDESSTGGADSLDKTAGSILQLGAICQVDSKRLEKALSSVKAAHSLPEGVSAMTPPWTDGSVDLITLDAAKSDYKDTFVRKIVGSSKPSLGSPKLDTIFHVRFDKEGTQLIYDSMKGSQASVVGIMYELKYVAVRPAVQMRITAHLDRCQKTTQHELGVDFKMNYYVNLSLGAQLEWLTKKMEENGDIEVEYFSALETPEEKKAADEILKSFKEDVVKELFEPFPDMDNTASITNDAKKASADQMLKQGVDAAKKSAPAAAAGAPQGGAAGTGGAAGAGGATGTGGTTGTGEGGNNGTGNGTTGGQQPEKPADQKWAEKFQVGITYAFKQHEITLNKNLTVDYREQSAVIRTHNPQSHIWFMMDEDKLTEKDYVSRVDFGPMFRTETLKVQLDYNFTAADSDLQEAEVVVWRKSAGKKEGVVDGFAMPDEAYPLLRFTFSEKASDARSISWDIGHDGVVGYYYQVRLAFKGDKTNIVSPRVIYTQPVFSSSEDLLISPDRLVYYKKYPYRVSGLQFGEITNADLNLTVDPESENPVLKSFRLDKDQKNEGNFIIRGKDETPIPLQVAEVFYFGDGRDAIKSTPTLQLTDEIIVSDPIVQKEFNFILAGVPSTVSLIWLAASVVSPGFQAELNRQIQLDPQKNLQSAKIPFYTNKDVIKYSIMVLDSGKVSTLGTGEIPASNYDPVVIDFSMVGKKKYTLVWSGQSPEDADLKELTAELKDAGGNVLKTIKYAGSAIPAPVDYLAKDSDEIYLYISRAFANGSTETEPGVRLNPGETSIRP